MCASLARRIGAAQAVVEGAGHEIQFTGDPINQALLSLWRSVPFELMAARVSSQLDDSRSMRQVVSSGGV